MGRASCKHDLQKAPDPPKSHLHLIFLVRPQKVAVPQRLTVLAPLLSPAKVKSQSNGGLQEKCCSSASKKESRQELPHDEAKG